MISRIYVTPKDKGAKGDSYLIESKFSHEKLRKLAEALTNPILEDFSIDLSPQVGNFSYAVEIGYLPGVTDNVAHSVKEIAKDLLQANEEEFEVYTSKIFFTKSKNKNEVEKFAAELYNPLIERANIVQVKAGKIELPNQTPKVVLKDHEPVIDVPLEVSDDELQKIGTLGIADTEGGRRGPLALDLDSMHAIQAHFRKLGRNPTDIELESLAQTWSEHCKHTIFANSIDDIEGGLYRTYIKGATNLIRKQKGKKDFCVSVFSDNAGGIIFDEEYLVTHKVETHNSPSALDPFGGAITGIVGVNRDTLGFGLGAKPVANTYGFCFSYPEDKRRLFKDKNLTQEMLPAKRIMDGVIKGINVGGNCSGIPTVNGFMRFDARFRGRPLVFAGTIGLIPRKIKGKLAHIKSAKVGDYVVMMGGRVGADGIHGATFSSVAMDSNSPATAVQIGDPITQKKLSDAIAKEARDMGLYNSVTDNGAGGISCSVAEMARDMELPNGKLGGAIVQIEKVPLKYPGLRPWEIWISESQERMTLAVPKNNWEKFRELMESRGVEATVIGQFTDTGKMEVEYQGKKIMDLELEFLHNGLPKHHLKTALTQEVFPEPKISKKSFTKDLENLLQNKNLSSNAFVSEQYDHEVQSSSVLKPLSGRGRINTDAQVFRPVLDSKKGVVVSSALFPSYSDISTYHMAACALDTAVRNGVASGAKLDHLAILDNFCWCSSNEPKRLAQLVDAVKACYDVAILYGTPFISGKDSMFNDFKGYDEKGNKVEISIPPTLLISSIGVMPDLYKTVSPEFKNAGDVIYVLGETKDELGASEFFKELGMIGNNVPQVDVEANMKVYKAVETAIDKGLLASSISVNSGGLGVALGKAAVGGMLGAQVSLKGLVGSAQSGHAKLFSESQGRILVSVAPKNVGKFEALVRKVPFTKLGKVSKDKKFVITEGKEKLVDSTVEKLAKNYHSFSNSNK